MSKTVLFIVEQGGYPLFKHELEVSGYRVRTAPSVRRALGMLKSWRPDLICAEFNFQSDFRDRVSNLDSLLARLQSLRPRVPLVALVETERSAQLERLRERFPVAGAVNFPLSPAALLAAFDEACAPAQDACR